MTTLEREIEAKLGRMVKNHGGLCLKWVCPSWSGVPDRIILLPGGVAMFVETKRPKGGKLSKLQEKWQGWLHGLGFWAGVIWHEADIDELEKIIIDRTERRTP